MRAFIFYVNRPMRKRRWKNTEMLVNLKRSGYVKSREVTAEKSPKVASIYPNLLNERHSSKSEGSSYAIQFLPRNRAALPACSQSRKIHLSLENARKKMQADYRSPPCRFVFARFHFASRANEQRGEKCGPRQNRFVDSSPCRSWQSI